MKKYSNSFSPDSEKHIIGGLLVGALVGAAAVFLISKKGREFTDSVCENCQNVTDKVKEFTWSRAKDESSSSTKKWLLLAGSILGISTAVLLSNTSGKTIFKNVAHTFETLNKKTHDFADYMEDSAHGVIGSWEERIVSWVKLAQNLFGDLQNNVKRVKQKTNQGAHAGEMIGDMVDWAITGARLLQNLRR